MSLHIERLTPILNNFLNLYVIELDKEVGKLVKFSEATH